IPRLPEIFDEPFSDSSQIPTYLVSRLARTKVTVSLSGDGGDELFGGYNRYLLAQSIWKAVKRVPQTARLAAAGMLRAVPARAVDAALTFLRPVAPGGTEPQFTGRNAHVLAGYLSAATRRDIYVRALSHWQDPAQVVRDASEPTTVFDSIAAAAEITGFEESMMLTDLVNYLPDDILTKVDRSSMAVSLEARVPLLDHRVVEFAWRLPLRFKIRTRTSKWVLRQVLYKYVPRELIERPKMGFGVPVGKWVLGPLRPWAEDLLSESSLCRHGLFAVAPIREKWREHIAGRRNWQYLLWDVLVFLEWHDKLSRLSHRASHSEVTARA